MNLNFLKLLALTIFVSIMVSSCTNSAPSKEIKISNNVAEGLEKTTAFERDTIRKDAVRVEKNKIKSPEK